MKADTTPALVAALKKAKSFIEYARYELQPGKAQLGDQFPRQDDADAVLGLIEAALREGQAAAPIEERTGDATI
jgi:hypothetical protein